MTMDIYSHLSKGKEKETVSFHEKPGITCGPTRKSTHVCFGTKSRTNFKIYISRESQKLLNQRL